MVADDLPRDLPIFQGLAFQGGYDTYGIVRHIDHIGDLHFE